MDTRRPDRTRSGRVRRESAHASGDNPEPPCPPPPSSRQTITQRLQHPHAGMDGFRYPRLIVIAFAVIVIADECAQLIVQLLELPFDCAVRRSGREPPQDPNFFVVDYPLAQLLEPDAIT